MNLSVRPRVKLDRRALALWANSCTKGCWACSMKYSVLRKAIPYWNSSWKKGKFKNISSRKEVFKFYVV